MAENENLKRFGAYQKALELFDLVVADMSPLIKNPTLHRMVSQQFASADSIASNIEEGYGRGSRKEYAQSLIIARGSAQETAGRYGRFRHWLAQSVVEARVALCSEIIGILSGSIKTLRRDE
jgi:four helix bundle protein